MAHLQTVGPRFIGGPPLAEGTRKPKVCILQKALVTTARSISHLATGGLNANSFAVLFKNGSPDGESIVKDSRGYTMVLTNVKNTMVSEARMVSISQKG